VKQIIVIVTLVGATIVSHVIASKIGNFPKISICAFLAQFWTLSVFSSSLQVVWQ